MNKEQTKEMIAVMQAYVDGKTIQLHAGGDRWDDFVIDHPSWNFSDFKYRIKPEPREVVVKIWGDGMVSGVVVGSSREKFFVESNKTSPLSVVKFVEVLK